MTNKQWPVIQSDLFKHPFYFVAIYYDGRKSAIREFDQYAQMVAEAVDLLKIDADVYRVGLCEFRKNSVPELVRWIDR